MTSDELAEVLDVMGAIWPHAQVHDRWGPGMALMCGTLDRDVVLDVVRGLALPAVGDAPAWPPAPNVVRQKADRRVEMARVAGVLNAGTVSEIETRAALGLAAPTIHR